MFIKHLHEDVLGEFRYSSTHTHTRIFKLEGVDGQLQTTADLHP